MKKRDVFSEKPAPSFVMDKSVRSTGYQRFHPVSAAVHLLSCMVLLMFSTNPVICGLGWISGLSMCLLLRRGRTQWSYYLWSIILGLAVILTNPLITHRGNTVLFFVNSNPFTLEAVFFGVYMAVILTAVLFWCRVWNTVMSTDRIMFILQKTLPKASLVLTGALRFFPLLADRWRQIRRAQLATGEEGRGIRAAAAQFSSLVTWSMEHAIGAAASMRSRGYGLKGRKSYTNFRFTGQDLFLLIYTIVLTGLTGWMMGTGALSYSFYPVTPPVSLTVQALTGYVCYGCLALFPTFFELGDMLFWTFLRRKI